LSLFNLYRYIECSYERKDHFKTVKDKSTATKDLLGAQEFIPLFWRGLEKIVKIPNTDLKVSIPQIMQSVSFGVTERLGLKGSSLFAAMHTVHNIRYIANLVSNVLSGGILYREIKKLGLSKRDFFSMVKLLKAFTVLTKTWWPLGNSVLAGPQNRATAVQLGDGLVMPTGVSLLNKRAYLGYMIRPNALLSTLDPVTRFLNRLGETHVPGFGRLCKLYEAAGKVRIIAIVDPFTNWLLKPLHDWVFAILRAIPQDGTFDQDKPINNLIALVKKRDASKRFIGSCDMSAATDRLPVKLQAMILAHVFGSKIANA